MVCLEFCNAVRKEKTNPSLPRTEDPNPFPFGVEWPFSSSLILFDDCKVLCEGLWLILVAVPSFHQSIQFLKINKVILHNLLPN